MVGFSREVIAAFACVLVGASASALRGEQLLNQTYDYIIVGGGTSGLTVANRLTANGKYSVLVVEYGELNNDPSILIPADTLNNHPDRFYNITSVPNPQLNNATARVSVGALVGGGSAVNGMFFDRGAASDYDAWETLGNPGWSFKDLLPYFKKSVTFTPPSAEDAAKYNYTWDIESAYGGQGEIQVSFPPYQFPGQEPVWEAWRRVGQFKPKEAANGSSIGAIQAPSALDPVTRTRSYARTAHYDPFATRENYHLLTGYQATEILFKEGGDLEASGVNVIKRGTMEKVALQAKKEVIVAAGAIWTPWLLQRSGIGPKKVLEKAGIQVKRSLPGVGSNFQDHPYGMVIWNWTKSTFSPTPNDLANATFYDMARKEYEQFRTGPLTPARGNQAAFVSLSTVDSMGWLKLVNAIVAQDPTPYLPEQYDETLVKGAKAQQNLTASLLRREDSAAYEFPFGAGPLSLGVLERPLSRGTVNINTANPSDVPVVDFRTFSNPLDVDAAARFVHFARRFNSLPVLDPLGGKEIAPGVDIYDDAAVEKFLRSNFNPTFAHPAGTASMLPEELGGVVSPELKVYGVGKLSVVDASVIPYLPGTHICTTVYAIAEKAADLIKKRTAWDA